MLHRRQPPVYSPLRLGAVGKAAARAAHLGPDPRTHLTDILRRRFEAEDVVLCGSGTEALTVAMSVANRIVGGGARVALPGFSCFDVATAAVAARVPVSLYDIDPCTLGPDFDSLRRCLLEGARVVVAAPLYGVPVDYDALAECVAPYEALVVEDAAQGHGAEWRGRPLGGWWTLSVLSFGRGKGWTGGKGGALLLREPRRTATPEIAADWRLELEALIVAAAQWTLARPRLYSLPAAMPWLRLGETHYRDPTPLRAMPRVAAALVLSTTARADAEALARRRHADLLLGGLRLGRRLKPVRPPGGASAGYLRLPLRAPGGLSAFGDGLQVSRLGVAASYPSTLAALPALQSLRVGASPLPGGEELARDLVTLPTHSLLDVRDRSRLLQTINTWAG